MPDRHAKLLMRVVLFALLVVAPQSIARADDEVGARDFSGIARFDQSSFVVVHDAKVGKDDDQPRVSILSVAGKRPTLTTVKVKWGEGREPSNDLEAVCPVPGTANNGFWMCESGYHGEKFGRLFRVTLKAGKKKWKAKVDSVFALPAGIADVEGVICVEQAGNAGGCLIVLATRGGGAGEAAAGKLIWGRHNAQTQQFDVVGSRILDLDPAGWPNRDNLRRCGDLYVDDQGIVWSAATRDPGDAGPFESYLYQLGPASDLVTSDATLLAGAPKLHLPGLKVEAIAASPFNANKLSIGTDDEDYGGLWRPLD